MPQPKLSLRGVGRTYDLGGRSLDVLQDIDLDVGAGEFVAIMGPSGSGKSTLLNILGCLDRPTEGAYLLDGDDVSRASVRRRARIRNTTFGFVFQFFNLLPRTSARENVELPLLYRDIEAARRAQMSLDALDSVGLGDRADHVPSQLSGGEQQRVAIARALVARPSVVLADEPTGAVDTRTGQTIMTMLSALNDSRLTVVVVTHDAEVAGYAKRLIRLRDGRIVADGPVSDRVPAIRG